MLSSTWALSLFRCLFGFLMIPQILHLTPFIHELGNSSFVFHYPYLSFIEAYSHELIDFLSSVSIISAILLALGILPRIAALLFMLSFGYLFLIDQAFYNNHYYLWCLIALLFSVIKTSSTISIFDLLKNNTKKQIDLGSYLLFGLLFSIVYFFGGIAKLTPDWLQGYPMILLTESREFPLPKETGLFLSYTGLFFDLSMPFLLWFKPKAWFIAVPYFIFHLSNYFIFNIGEFPIVMLAAWPIFIVISKHSFSDIKKAFQTAFGRLKPTPIFLNIFFCFQLIFPLRSYFIASDVAWHRQGYNFSWRMMVNNHEAEYFQFSVEMKDKNIQYYVDFSKLLTYRQFYHAYHEPFMIWQLAQKLKTDAQTKYQCKNVSVYCNSVIKLNNRPPRALINTSIDLSKTPYDQFRKNEFIQY